nr:hypothetical protein CFP56_63240 [Quercus suber]
MSSRCSLRDFVSLGHDFHRISLIFLSHISQKPKVSSHLDSSIADSTSLITEERIISRFGSIVVEFFWYYCCTVTECFGVF